MKEKILSLLISDDRTNIELGIMLNKTSKCFPILAKFTKKKKALGFEHFTYDMIYYGMQYALVPELKEVSIYRIRYIIEQHALIGYRLRHNNNSANYIINSGGISKLYKKSKVSSFIRRRAQELKNKYGTSKQRIIRIS